MEEARSERETLEDHIYSSKQLMKMFNAFYK